MIAVENLSKSFDGVPVLRGASFRIEQGELVALIGPSGEGKSVTLKHISGLMKPDGGRVLIDQYDIHRASRKELANVRFRLGFLFQNGALFDSITVFDNVAFPLRETTQLKEIEIREKVFRALESVGLRGSEDKYPAQLSGGMAKRAALARCLVREPTIMLFDEPTTGLDPTTENAITRLIDQCHRRFHFTGIIVTHQIPEIFDIVQKVVMLYEGTVRFCGTPAEVVSSRDETLHRFISGEAEEDASGKTGDQRWRRWSEGAGEEGCEYYEEA